MSNFIQITPVMHVQDVHGAVDFFCEVLGFTCPIRHHDYAYVHRETVGVRILKASESEGEQVPPGTRRFMYYIDVHDVDAMYEELKLKFEGVVANDPHGPVDQSYGQLELMVIAPDGNLMVFGQAIAKTS